MDWLPTSETKTNPLQDPQLRTHSWECSIEEKSSLSAPQMKMAFMRVVGSIGYVNVGFGEIGGRD